MITTTFKAVVVLVGLFAAQRAYPQGAFVNLDFEQAIAPLVPDADHDVPIAQALPGWTGYVAGGQVPVVAYNTIPLSAPGIGIEDKLAPGFLQPLQGDYSVWLSGSTIPGQDTAAIAQIGQIPADAKSVRFLFTKAQLPLLTFAGQWIPLVVLGENANYFTVGGDVSLLAGETGELRFTALPQYTAGLLDNIQFSPVAIVPEPAALVLALLGLLAVGHRMNGSVP